MRLHKLLSVFLIFMILAVPFASGETVERTARIERAEGYIQLNISNPEELKKYAPVERFWNDSSAGIIVDGILPPDLLNVSGDITLSWNFTLGPNTIEDGASHFILRLPASVEHFDSLYIEIRDGSTLVGSYTGDVSYYNITYAGMSLSLVYVDLKMLIFSGDTYTLNITFNNLEGSLLIFSYDYLNDSVANFTMNKKTYPGDLAIGFDFLQLTSNSISSISVGNCTVNVPLHKTYDGSYYVSYAFLIYANQNTSITISIKDSCETYNVTEGINTIRGNQQINLSSTDSELTLNFSSTHSIDLIVEGYGNTISEGDAFTNAKLYGDIVINKEEYYIPGAVVLPGSWQESFALARKYAPAAELNSIIVRIEDQIQVYTIIRVWAYTAYLFYKGMDFIAGKIVDLVGDAIEGLFKFFKWVYTEVVYWFISNVGKWIWAFLEALWYILQVTVYLFAAWVTDSFLRGLVRLPRDGISGMLEEWSGVTEFTERTLGILLRRR